MKHSIFGYLLGEGFRNVFHNKKSSGASLAIMCATMLIFGLFFMIIENLNNAVETLETQQGIQVFIQKTATDAQMEQIGEQIQAIDGVNKVTFVSKEDALNQTKEKLKDKQALIAGWDESNPFKASYLVTLTDLKLSSQVQDEIKKIDNIDSIQSRDETINGLVAIANGVRIVSAVILTLLVLISIFIIGNTIKLTVHARRKEISIMKYVGATDSFIRWPFVIEGIIIGIVAALLSILVLGIAYSLITNAAANSIISTMGIKLLSFTDMTTLLVIVYMVLGIGIGALGSSISMRKYLQV
ncbi:MAG: permease-like cell division protein FtsX [Clostridium sp.]|nr:permease-like cell division protein FtsX [Clostridium sp.]CDA58880.1 cell division protein [Clostridium sp. CAG:245]